MSDYNQRDQSVKNQFNIGRDQVIQNLVLVGQLLDFAQVEGLLPKPSSTSIDLTKMLQSVEKNIDKQVDNNLGYAAAFAGDILKESVQGISLKNSYSIVPIKSILERLPHQIHYRLQDLNYWEAYAIEKKGYHGILLDSLSTLWKKRFWQNRDFMITDWGDCKLIYWTWYSSDTTHVEIKELSIEQCQVATLGLAIDLMRLYMTAENDMRTWRGIMKSFGLNK